MMYLAHISQENRQQSLKAHSFNSASYACSVLEGTIFSNMARCGGFLHDMGKAKTEFQEYLRDENAKRGSVNHTFAAVIWILENFHSVQNNNSFEFMLSEILSFAVGSHHGMFDCCGLNCEPDSSKDRAKNGFIHRLDYNRKSICYEESVKVFFEQVCAEEELKSLFEKSASDFKSFLDTCKNFLPKIQESMPMLYFCISMLCRLLLSSIIYADRRDTIEFMRQPIHKSLKPDWQHELFLLEEKLDALPRNALSDVRRNISEQCKAFAENPSGIYKLNVPTGGGKTLSLLRYAYAHAAKYGKKRIIVVIPLLSILDQNAKIIREYISDEKYIFEHHSNVLQENSQSKEALDNYELLAASWDSPVVITTLVQFLNVLFAHKTSQIGRMQALVDSIVIIDEIQSLPLKTICMFNMAVNFFAKFCNTTFILSSATQPAFAKVKWPVIYSEPEDMVKLNHAQTDMFKRAEIIDKTDPYGMNFDECADFCCEQISECSSVLLICNTKREARDIYRMAKDRLQDETDTEIFHLSTSMCKAHRTRVLDNVKARLDSVRESKSGKVMCISTQLVEAGIDFSFERVIRVIAGVDNLAQAAGRCNRSNEYGNAGKFFVIKLKDESKSLTKLKDIKNAQDCTLEVMNSSNGEIRNNLIGDEAVKLFYRKLYEHEQANLAYPVKDHLYLAKLLANENSSVSKTDEAYFLHVPFKSVAEKFQVFDDNTYDVLVPYAEGREKIDALRSEFCDKYKIFKAYEKIQDLQQYAVNIYEWQKNSLIENGFLEAYPSNENCKVLILSAAAYDDETGVTVPEDYNVEDFII